MLVNGWPGFTGPDLYKDKDMHITMWEGDNYIRTYFHPTVRLSKSRVWPLWNKGLIIGSRPIFILILHLQNMSHHQRCKTPLTNECVCLVISTRSLCLCEWCDVMWCDVMWCDVMWCDVMWCDVMWCDVMWCDVMWCDVMWCDVMWCDLMTK